MPKGRAQRARFSDRQDEPHRQSGRQSKIVLGDFAFAIKTDLTCKKYIGNML